MGIKARLRKREEQQGIVGVGCYRWEQWERLLEISTDRDRLEDTHEEWLKNATRVFDRLKRQGVPVIKTDIDVEDLLAWCAKNGLAVNGESRAKYVVEKTSHGGKELAQRCKANMRSGAVERKTGSCKTSKTLSLTKCWLGWCRSLSDLTVIGLYSGAENLHNCSVETRCKSLWICPKN
ncbi:MAG TPA: hypothetical protein VKM93_14345 [Terriglobia bacterium]|nr:hypothetical protein [Terriglobia bacterium]